MGSNKIVPVMPFPMNRLIISDDNHSRRLVSKTDIFEPSLNAIASAFINLYFQKSSKVYFVMQTGTIFQKLWFLFTFKLVLRSKSGHNVVGQSGVLFTNSMVWNMYSIFKNGCTQHISNIWLKSWHSTAINIFFIF